MGRQKTESKQLLRIKCEKQKNIIESSKESEVLKKMNERQKCMILGRDFNYRLESMERGNSLFEFLISSNLLCINDNKKVMYEYQRGKRVTDFFFVSNELPEHFKETKFTNSLLTKHKQVSCCFGLKSRKDITESKRINSILHN